uniref:Putative radical SAM superfamily protein n=1 Tax=viral metagenome TaxID=1070528 RepID=A0A6M3ISP9_9ZZZZ
MKILRIGFIQAKQETDVQWFKPLAFGYLKAYLEKKLDNPPSFEFIKGPVDTNRYDIIVISSTSQDYSEAKRIAADIKRKNKSIITVLGGHHVTYLPSTLSSDFDLGVSGEGEQTFLELVEYFQNNVFNKSSEELKNIKGLAIHKNNEIILTGKRDLIDPLDNIPHPYRQLDDTQYLFTSRGCPYKCVFCSSSAFWNKTRVFSAEYVVDEIEQILKLFPDTSHIPIEDDIFIIDLPRLEKIIDLMEERQLSKRVAFSFAVRANLVTDQLCELFKRFNVRTVCFGAESASDRILEILKKKTTVAQNQAALDILHTHGLTTVCSFIVGVPTETKEEVIATYEFIIKNILERKLGLFSTINILTPMPGTEIWDHAVNQGLVNVSNMEWSRLAGFASYRTSNIISFSEWIKHREKNKSIYLNEDTLAQCKLYEIMNKYEEKIKNIERGIISGKSIIHPESKLAHKYCIGKGLEIGGSAHNPFGLDTINVDITDSMTTRFKKEEINLCGKALLVDIVAPGDAIPLPGASQDFVISSHVLEHFTNPIKALIEWNRLLKPGGIIFMIIPHKERTSDKKKERTTLQHLIDDYQNETTKSNDDENGHEHVWITEDIVNLLYWMINNLDMKWTIEEVQDTDDKVRNGFTIVIRKHFGIATETPKITIGFGALVNDPYRLDMVLRQSELEGDIFFIKEPTSATLGLNKLLDLIQGNGFGIAALVHQDMFFQNGWIETVKSQLVQLPDNWVVAGIIGKDKDGTMCGRLHDMRMPLLFNSDHAFPVRVSCFDECVIFVNLKSGFRFDEQLDGFDLYGTLAVLQAEEMGGSAWIIDAFAEHYCMRKFPWKPGDDFKRRVEWLSQRFPNAEQINSTAFGLYGFLRENLNPEVNSQGKEEVLCLQEVAG